MFSSLGVSDDLTSRWLLTHTPLHPGIIYTVVIYQIETMFLLFVFHYVV